MNDNALCLVQPADMETATGYDSSVDFPSPVYYKPKSEKGDGFEEVWGNITPPPRTKNDSDCNDLRGDANQIVCYAYYSDINLDKFLQYVLAEESLIFHAYAIFYILKHIFDGHCELLHGYSKSLFEIL